MARIEIIDIRPAATPDVQRAIELALAQVWPAPPRDWEPTATDRLWRFGSRPWTPPPIPLRQWSRP